MSVEGLSAIGQRIAQLQSLVADPALAASAIAAGSASSSSSSAFAAALADALAAQAATGTTSLDGSDSGSSLLGASGASGTGSSSAALLSALGLSGTSGTGSSLLASLGASSTGSSLLASLGLSGTSGSGTSLLASLGLAAGAGGGSDTALLSALGLSGGTSGVSVASLASALGLSGTPAADSASTTSTGAFTADGVPADLARYGNGHIPTSALAPVGTTGIRMWQPAAQALTNLIAAAKADGVTIGVTEGYRSYDEQVSLARTKGLYSQGGLAAEPGTSEHGWGMAADLKLDSSALAWMRANASSFGFVADTPRESWHWAYHPSTAA